MKTQTQMTEKNSMKTLILIAASLLPMLANAGDGGGVNGPNFSGQSIPVQLDGSIDATQVDEAMRVCYVTGDPSRGVHSMLSQVADVFYKDRIEAGKNPSVFLNQTNAIKDGTHYFGLTAQAYYPEVDSTSVSIEATRNGVYSSFNLRTASGKNIYLNAEGVFPTVVASVEASCEAYDVWGSCENPRKIAKDIQIKLGRFHGIAAALRNPETGRETTFKVNTVSLVDCLSSELQRRAK